MKVKEKLLEEFPITHPHDTEKLIEELWTIMFSDTPYNKDAREKLVAIYRKLKYLAKKEKKLKDKDIKKSIKAKRVSDEEKENQRSHAG